MRPMPSPKGTNKEGFFLRDGAVTMALDERPKRRLAKDGLSFQEQYEILQRLLPVISPALYTALAAELGKYEEPAPARDKRRGAFDESEVQATIVEDLGDLKEKIPEELFGRLQEALAAHYRDKFEEDLEQTEEQLESGEALAGDRLSPRLRAMVAEGVAKHRAKHRARAEEMFPGLKRIKVMP